MTVGHCLRDHGTETKNSFDSVTRSLKWYYDQKIISFFSSDFERVFA